MTDEKSVVDPNDLLAASIMQKAKAEGIRAHVEINKIPPNIAANICEFLRRCPCTGMEAIAWAEAYSFMQQHVPQQGAPFPGLPARQG